MKNQLHPLHREVRYVSIHFLCFSESHVAVHNFVFILLICYSKHQYQLVNIDFIALFHVCPHIYHEDIVLPTSLLNF